jgi:hypothetical protein
VLSQLKGWKADWGTSKKFGMKEGCNCQLQRLEGQLPNCLGRCGGINPYSLISSIEYLFNANFEVAEVSVQIISSAMLQKILQNNYFQWQDKRCLPSQDAKQGHPSFAQSCGPEPVLEGQPESPQVYIEEQREQNVT